jgi:hypothetical protein
MYESAVSDNAEDYPTVVIGVKFVSTFVIGGGISPWVQILGKMPELKMMLKEF